MRQKYILPVLLCCIVGLIGLGSWFWYSAMYDRATTSVQEFSSDEDSFRVKKVPLPEKKPDVLSESVKVESNMANITEPTLVDVNGAVNLYKRQYPTAQITGITFEEDGGRKSYEVAGISSEAGHSVKIDAMTGQVYQSVVDEKQNTEAITIDLGDIITPEEAGNVAISVLGRRAKLVKWDLEVRGYVAQYHMILELDGQTVFVVIDAFSSSVIEVVRER